MTTDKTSKIGENPKKKKHIQRSDEGKRGHSLDLWEVWSRNYRFPPLGAAKENDTEIFEITTFLSKSRNTVI